MDLDEKVFHKLYKFYFVCLFCGLCLFVCCFSVCFWWRSGNSPSIVVYLAFFLGCMLGKDLIRSYKEWAKQIQDDNPWDPERVRDLKEQGWSFFVKGMCVMLILLLALTIIVVGFPWGLLWVSSGVFVLSTLFLVVVPRLFAETE